MSASQVSRDRVSPASIVEDGDGDWDLIISTTASDAPSPDPIPDLASSTDYGESWTAHDGNPLYNTLPDWADERVTPQAVTYDQSNGEWVMLFGSIVENNDSVPGIRAVGALRATELEGPWTEDGAPFITVDDFNRDNFPGNADRVYAKRLYYDSSAGEWLAFCQVGEDYQDGQGYEHGLLKGTLLGSLSPITNNPIIEKPDDDTAWDSQGPLPGNPILIDGTWYAVGHNTQTDIGLYYSDDPEAKWNRHPDNPIIDVSDMVTTVKRARLKPAGGYCFIFFDGSDDPDGNAPYPTHLYRHMMDALDL